MIPRPDKPAWQGPYEGGITQSISNEFLQDPFSFYLKYYCGLKIATPLHPNLIWGDILHVGLQYALRGEQLDTAIEAMMNYLNKRYPRCPASYGPMTTNMLKLYPVQQVIDEWEGIDTEIELDCHFKLNDQYIFNPDDYPQYGLFTGRIVRVRGKVDMLSKSRHKLGDHKCKGFIDPAKTAIELLHDFQMNLYARLNNYIEDWTYDIIQIPEAAYRVPPQREMESGQHYADRLFYKQLDGNAGYPIERYPNRWIFRIPYFQPRWRIDNYVNYTVSPIMTRICEWWERVTHPNFDPNNPAWYSSVFYQSPVRLFDPARTEKFDGPYHALLTEQIGYESLVPVKSFYAELEDAD